MLLFLCFCLVPSIPALAAGSILVWPVDPVIEHDQRAAALWLENRGRSPSLLQIRIFSWTQVDGEDRYADQDEIVGTPPMIRIEPGKRQMVRLTRIHPVARGVERAYRVVVDEVPTPAASQPVEDNRPSVGVRFQFRYSIPLFVQGEGLWTKARTDRRRNPASASQPDLSWRFISHEGKPELEIRNAGLVSARLTEVHVRQGGTVISLAKGLFGYVLAGASIRRPLPKSIDAGADLIATVNSSQQTLTFAAEK